jgi:hypothetical protein
MSVFSDIAEYLRVYRSYIGRRIYLVFALTFLAALAEGFGITLFLPLLRTSEAAANETQKGGLEEVLFDVLAWFGIADSMVGILLFIAVAFLLKAALKFSQKAYEAYLSSCLLRELKGGMFDTYGGMDYRLYISNSTGHFLNIIGTQINRFYASFKDLPTSFPPSSPRRATSSSPSSCRGASR